MIESIREHNWNEMDKIAVAINQSSHRAFELLTNLLDWSRSQTGKMELNPEHFDLGETIHKVLKLADEAATQKSITISGDFPAATIVYGDNQMIESVIRNLITNAIKFTHPGGKIDISVENKQKSSVISVCDNGIGIPKEYLNKLFRIDAGYSTKGTQNERGTGLGLILCKEFVEKHKGKIWVESKEGKGSAFRFSIPANPLGSDTKD